MIGLRLIGAVILNYLVICLFWWMLFYFALGAVIGSFVCCCSGRLAEGRSISGRSVCNDCGHKLAAHDLVPVLSYLLLRGRCRYCGAAIGSTCLWAELTGGAAFALCGWQTAPGLELMLLFIFAGLLLLIALIDCQQQIIPDGLVLATALGGLLYGWLYLPGGIMDSLLGALIAFGIMLAIFVISRGGMGGGDVKLSAAVGLWLGMDATLMFLLLAFMAGGIYSAVLLLGGSKTGGEAISFGPFLCAAAFVTMLYSPYLLSFYWNLF